MASPLDRTRATPLYHQLEQILLEEIRSGRLEAGDRLPNEEQLSTRYGVSLITVRRTLSDLAAAGYVRREQGRGTFVAPPSVVQGPRELTSFTEDMARRGWKASARVLAQEIVPATEDIAEALGTLKGARIFRLRRLRLADGEPLGIQTAHIPESIAPGIASEKFENASLYDLLARRYAITIAHAREIHAASILSPADCRLLNVRPRSAGLTVRRITYAPGRRPIELVDTVMRSDRYQVILDLVPSHPYAKGAVPS
jgi:GntR family transcriptional regulator